MEDNLFCPKCNWSITPLMYTQAALDFPCCNCEGATISGFYQLGSVKHREMWRSYLKGYRTALTPRGKLVKAYSPIPPKRKDN